MAISRSRSVGEEPSAWHRAGKGDTMYSGNVIILSLNIDYGNLRNTWATMNWAQVNTSQCWKLVSRRDYFFSFSKKSIWHFNHFRMRVSGSVDRMATTQHTNKTHCVCLFVDFLFNNTWILTTQRNGSNGHTTTQHTHNGLNTTCLYVFMIVKCFIVCFVYCVCSF